MLARNLPASQTTEKVVENCPIVMGFDLKYARAGFTVMQSVLETTPDAQFCAFNVLHDGLPDFAQRLGHLLFDGPRSSITFIDVRPHFDHLELFETRHLSRAMYYRLLIPILFRNAQAVIYLDSDMVCRRNIFAMVDALPPGACLGAVRDNISRGDRARGAMMRDVMDHGPEDMLELSLADYKRDVVGLDNPDRYFNSGMVFFRPSEITDSDVQACFDLCHAPRYCPDQDILNTIFGDRTHLLPERWNYVLTFPETVGLIPDDWMRHHREEEEHAAILHWPGPRKPWRDPSVPQAEVFLEMGRRLDERLQEVAPEFFKDVLPAS
ncbi:glycosyltransferase family 8 protein [Oecophyllibacter saccharovorans]|uniref:Glycosyltransferase family 8 protein n=1 Tax=Oecophyllibacter saccharovorans TaxID=2558360 RepID=A0A506UKJ0_9PROT|nr:glycosyltransferase [Oecophyllibacter saccharovorans]TPW33830.1 hypothetical protein E3202_04330 [Oecophyllibacter saccharovorans]